MNPSRTLAELTPTSGESEPPPRREPPALALARSAAARAPDASATRRRFHLLRDSTLLLRRAHLYAGLMMLPWVFLYGITGLLFNHPTWFSDQKVLTFGPAEVRGTSLEGLSTARDLATEVVARINARGKGAYRLVSPREARFERGGLAATVVGADGATYSATIDPGGEGGTVRPVAPSPKAKSSNSAPAGKPAASPGAPRAGRGGGRDESGGGREGAAPFAMRGVELESSPIPRIGRGLPAVLARIGLAGASISEVRAAPLSFLMEGDGGRWLVTYAISGGVVSGRSAEDSTAGAELTTRRFLLRLHTAHGYPSEFNARWAWAVLVDVMSTIMVFWGVSGLVMWWQIKRTRRVGAVALALSVVAASWVFVEMHGLLVAAGR